MVKSRGYSAEYRSFIVDEYYFFNWARRFYRCHPSLRNQWIHSRLVKGYILSRWYVSRQYSGVFRDRVIVTVGRDTWTLFTRNAFAAVHWFSGGIYDLLDFWKRHDELVSKLALALDHQRQCSHHSGVNCSVGWKKHGAGCLEVV